MAGGRHGIACIGAHASALSSSTGGQVSKCWCYVGFCWLFLLYTCLERSCWCFSWKSSSACLILGPYFMILIACGWCWGGLDKIATESRPGPSSCDVLIHDENNAWYRGLSVCAGRRGVIKRQRHHAMNQHLHSVA